MSAEIQCKAQLRDTGFQTEAALIGNYGREQTNYRYVLYLTPLQKTQTTPFNWDMMFIEVLLSFSDVPKTWGMTMLLLFLFPSPLSALNLLKVLTGVP